MGNKMVLQILYQKPHFYCDLKYLILYFNIRKIITDDNIKSDTRITYIIF